MKYAVVTINTPVDKLFTYGWNLPSEPIVGLRVLVPFANRKKSVVGVVVEVSDSLPADFPKKVQVKFVESVLDSKPILPAELLDLAKWLASYYLCAIGEAVFLVCPVGTQPKRPKPLQPAPKKQIAPLALSVEQKSAVDKIIASSSSFSLHYIYGPTGSGKTEVYLCVADAIIKNGGSVIYLVPEISLTPQLIDTVTARYGDLVAVLHSGITANNRFVQWQRILAGDARFVIGVRSAIFAPAQHLGLIIIDEEHETTYKSSDTPRYNARQVALHRSRSLNIPCIMGSATPSVESFALMQAGKITRHTLTKRLAGGAFPTIKPIDMNTTDDIISPKLEDAIRQTLIGKKQVILFLNKMGFSHFLKCTDCGYEYTCKNCSVHLTYHKERGALVCHYCGYTIPLTRTCPNCGSSHIVQKSLGTEFVTEKVVQLFPSARVVRVDSDSVKSKDLKSIIKDFETGNIDILMGTQMVAKGLNFPNLKLVGVIMADTTLRIPDFRAAERTFSLITQVAGRAGRYHPDGIVLVQTLSPNDHAVHYAITGETDAFYKKELQNRTEQGWPPSCRLIQFIFRSKDKRTADTTSKEAAAYLETIARHGTQVVGPAPCSIIKINNNYRYTIFLRGEIGTIHAVAKRFLQTYHCPYSVYIEVDVDPVMMG